MKPVHNIQRVHCMLQRATCPQAVLRDRLGRLELVAATSPRVAALGVDRLAGVFLPSVPLSVFRREVSLA